MVLFRQSKCFPFVTEIGLAVLSSFLIYLSIPKVEWWLVAWIAFVPILIALKSAGHSNKIARICLVALVFGFFSGVSKVYWIMDTVMNYGGLDVILGLVSMIGVALLVASYTFIFGIFVARTDWRSPFFPVFSASIWTALEYVQTYLFTGFPWELLGYSQYQVLPVIQIARFTGVYGVSFLVMLMNATLAMIFVALRDQFKWRSPVFAISLSCFSLISVLGYGWWSLSPKQEVNSGVSPVTVSVIQGSMEQGIKWSEGVLQKTVNIYKNLTRKALPQNPDLIVFPETAMTFYLESPAYRELNEQIHELTDEAGVPLLTGALGSGAQGKGVYNSAFLFLPGLGIVDSYSKMHLVPFGEYLPLPQVFGFLGGLTGAIGSLTPGAKLSVMELNQYDIGLGTVICYESIFPDLVRRFPLNGANVLVVMTNDAWFGTSSAPNHHFSMAVLRAVENGTPVIRAANTGISGFIAATGAVYGTTPLMVATTTTEKVQPRVGKMTFYTRYGDIFAVLCCIVCIAAAALTGSRNTSF